jgi:hypothetical protein
MDCGLSGDANQRWDSSRWHYYTHHHTTRPYRHAYGYQHGDRYTTTNLCLQWQPLQLQ